MDNARAKKLASGIADMPGIRLDPEKIETNIIIFGFEHPKFSIPEFLAKLKEHGILALATTGGIRFVTHKDVGDEDIDKAILAFRRLLDA